MPSFFNGIFGHKPSPEIVPNTGQFPDATGNKQQFLCTGPMCRYAQDLKPLLRVCVDIPSNMIFAGWYIYICKLNKIFSMFTNVFAYY